MGQSVVAAIGWNRKKNLVQSNGVVCITTFSHEKVVGYFYSKLYYLPISPHAKEVLVRGGNLWVKGIIRGEDLNFPSPWGKI